MGFDLATSGSDKVGFTLVTAGGDRPPQPVRGLRGAVERNVMRHYLAMKRQERKRQLNRDAESIRYRVHSRSRHSR